MGQQKEDRHCLSYGLLSDGMESQDPAGSEQVACTEGEWSSLSGESLNCDSIEKLRLIIEEERWRRGKESLLGYTRGKFAGERGSLKRQQKSLAGRSEFLGCNWEDLWADNGELLCRWAIEELLGINPLIRREWEQGNHISYERSNFPADAGRAGVKFCFKRQVLWGWLRFAEAAGVWQSWALTEGNCKEEIAFLMRDPHLWWKRLKSIVGNKYIAIA